MHVYFIGWAIGTALTGWLLSVFGFKANIVQSPETINGIKLFLSFLPAIACIISAVFIFFYPLYEKKVMKMNIELDEKKMDNYLSQSSVRKGYTGKLSYPLKFPI